VLTQTQQSCVKDWPPGLEDLGAFLFFFFFLGGGGWLAGFFFLGAGGLGGGGMLGRETFKKSDKNTTKKNKKTPKLSPPPPQKKKKKKNIRENHGLRTDCCAFGQLFPFQLNELRGQTFLIAGNRGRMANPTAKNENRNESECDRLVRSI